MFHSIEKLVLDSELFIREAKQVFLADDVDDVDNKDEAKKHQFETVMAKRFEAGHAMEIVDGDTDKV